jgi:PTS system nitrogen regulatory IIA component
MYLNLVQIAESFGVSESTVHGWMRSDGLPHSVDCGRYLFDRAQVLEWAAAHGLAAQAGFLATQPAALGAGCELTALLKAGGIHRDVAAADVINKIDSVVAALPGAAAARQLVSQRLRVRDGITWAPIGGGIALPHPSARIALGRDAGAIALLMLRDEFHPPGGEDAITRMFFFIAPSPRAHLEILARLSRGLAAGVLRRRVSEAAPDAEIYAALGGKQ